MALALLPYLSVQQYKAFPFLSQALMDVDGQSSRQPLPKKMANLQSMPTNVLINIFGRACPSPYDRRLLYMLSMVCKRFAAVLRQPNDLWSVMMLSLPRCACSRPLSLFT